MEELNIKQVVINFDDITKSFKINIRKDDQNIYEQEYKIKRRNRKSSSYNGNNNKKRKIDHKVDNNEHIDSSKHDFNGIKISFPPQYVQNKNKEDNINNDGVNLKYNNMSNEPILHKIDENQISKKK